jgi:hypothetical protein
MTFLNIFFVKIKLKKKFKRKKISKSLIKREKNDINIKILKKEKIQFLVNL